MNESPLAIVDRFAGLRVLVIGEAMLDSYLEGSTGRLCREAPVPVVNLARRRDIPGGAANTAMNLHSLGAKVTFLSVVGADFEAQLLMETLEAAGLSTDGVLRSPQRRTLAKHRVVADSQIVVRFDQGSTDPLDEESEGLLLERVRELAPTHDAILVSDYSYGVITPAVLQCLQDVRDTAQVLVADSRRLPAYRDLHCTAVKPNWEETCHLLDLPENAPDRVELVLESQDLLLEETGASLVAVTLDREGTIFIQEGEPALEAPARQLRHASVAGAGDTFAAGLALALAAGASAAAAAEIASAAAAVVVAKDGTAACTVSELRQALAGSEKFIADLDLLASWCDACRHDGRTIVFTNGCFDILHAGHISYLNQARALGDMLVVGLNTDASVRRLKGAERPINSLEDRARVLAALSCVDYVVPFGEDTPAAIIRRLRPDILAKGGDYTEETLPEAPLMRELGGRVAIMPFVENYSTTSVIARIRHAEGATRRRDDRTVSLGAGHEPAVRPAR